MGAEGPTSYGDLVRRYRVAAGLTQEELAERAGLSVASISGIERGAGHTPRKDTVVLLADALALTPQERATFVAARQHGAGAGRPRRHALTRTAAPPFVVGRAPELQLLERHLAGDGPPLLLLAGEPGIGKSRLLEEAAWRTEGHGLSVLAGGCQRRGGQDPYAPLLQALERHVHGQAAAQMRVSLRGCAWLVRLLPELARGPIEPLPSGTLAPYQERRLLFRAVAQYLGNVSGPAGTLLVLDDLHWAGPDALDLLATLVRSGDTPIRVVGANRETEVGATHPLSVTLADLAHAGLAAHHRLDPLAPEGAAALFDHLLDRATLEATLRNRVLQRTGGAPFFLVSCAQALRTQPCDGASADEVPWTVSQGIRQRIAALPAGTQELLGVAAVIGRQVPRRVLQGAWGRSEDDVLATLEAAVHARLVDEDGAETYHFAHDLIREVVEADLSAARRAAFHGQVAAALEVVHADAMERVSAEVAAHYELAGEIERAIAAYERAAGAAQRLYAHADAIAHYERALALLGVHDDRLPTAQRNASAARIQEGRGDILAIVGRHDDARDAFQGALSHLPAQDMLGRSRLLRKAAKPLVQQLRLDEALSLLNEAERALGSEPHAADEGARAWRQAWIDVQFERRGLYYWGGQWTAIAEATERVSPVVEQAGSPFQRALLIDNIGVAFQRDRYVISDETLATQQAVLATWHALGDLNAATEAQFNLGFCYLWRGALDDAEHYISAALATAVYTGDAWQQACYLAYLTVIARKRGRLDEVQCLATRGMSLAVEANTRPYMGIAHANLAWLAYRHGDIVTARASGDAALEAWQSAPAFPFQWLARWPLLAVALEQHDLTTALAHARTLLVPPQQPLPAGLQHLVEASIAADEAGQPEMARVHLQQALVAARELAYL